MAGGTTSGIAKVGGMGESKKGSVLAAALARPRRKGEAAPGQPHEQQRRNQEQHQDDDEDHQELQGERTVGTEERLQDPRLS